MAINLGKAARIKNPSVRPLNVKRKFVNFGNDNNQDKVLTTIWSDLNIIYSSLKFTFKLSKKQNRKDDIKKEQEENKKEEEKLEKKSGIKLPTIANPLKKINFNFFDKFGNFIFFTFMGWLFNNFSLGGKGNLLIKVTSFITAGLIESVNFIFMTIFETVVNFIDIGYKINDSIRGSIKKLGGEKSAGIFDKFTDRLKYMGNIMIISSMLILSTMGATKVFASSVLEENKQKNKGTDPDTDTSSKGKKGPTSTAIRKKPKTRIKKAGQIGKALMNRRGRKVLLKSLRPFLKRLTIVGRLIDFGVSVALGEPVGRAAFSFIGAGLLGVLGAGLGGPVGAILGGLAGDFIGAKVYDILFSGKKNLLKDETQKNQGGGVVRKKKRRRVKASRPRTSKRTIRSSPQKITPPIIREEKTRPGKDVGGEVKIKNLYPDPESGLFGFRDNQPNSFKALTKTSEILKTVPLFGPLMGAAVDVALGQMPSKTTYKTLTDSIAYIVKSFTTDNTRSLLQQIPTMASGGEVPFERSIAINKELNNQDQLARVIENSIDQRLREALRNIQNEVNKKRETPGGGPGSPGSPGSPGGSAGGEYGGYAPTGIQKEIYDYLINQKGLNDIQALGLMANIDRESSFRLNAREPGGTGVGLFQWSHGRVAPFMKAVPDWETNWKAQIDYALSEPERLSLVAPGEYKSKQFKSAQEAADWWMNEWERPRNPSSGSRKHSVYLSSVPKGPEGSAKFRGPEIPSIAEGGIKPSESGAITSRFGPRWGRQHKGVDYGLDVGTPISIIKPGKVVDIEQGHRPGNPGAGGGYGNFVVVQHKDGTYSQYNHLDKVQVREGQTVGKGEVIGTVGDTGRSTGPHLDFMIGKRRGGDGTIDRRSAINPERLADNYFRFGGNVTVKPSIAKEFPAILNGQEGVYITQEDGTRKWVKKPWTKEQRAQIERTRQRQQSGPSIGRPAAASPFSGPGSGKDPGLNGDQPGILQRAGSAIQNLFQNNRINTLDRQRSRREGGGPVFGNQTINSKNIDSYASYNEPDGQVHLAILPVIIKSPPQQMAKTMGYPFISSGSSGGSISEMKLQLSRS